MPLADLSDIQTLDSTRIEELKNQVPGDASLFIRLFDLFEKEGPELIGDLMKALPQGDPSQIHEVIHKVKGSAAAMGALRIFALASSGVKVCLEEEDLSELQALPDMLEREYALYCEQARPFLY